MQFDFISTDDLWLLIPGAEWSTDVVLVFVSGSFFENMAYIVGLGFFFFAQYIRCFGEGLSIPWIQHHLYWLSDEPFRNFAIGSHLFDQAVDRNGDYECLIRLLQIPFGVIFALFYYLCWIPVFCVLVVPFLGMLAAFERIVRIVFCLLDPFFACGVLQFDGCDRGCRFIVRDEVFLLTYAEKEFMADKKWWGRYFHMVESLIAGGRWKVVAYWKWKLQKEQRDNESIHELKHIAKDFTFLALFEEVAETIGGIVMSVDVIWLNPVSGVSYIVAWVSLATSCLSFAVETGYFYGWLHKHYRQRADSETDDEEEGSR